MEEINLDKSDRGNLYKEDAINVKAFIMNADDDDIDTSDLEDAANEMTARGDRVAYVVVKIVRE